MPVDKKEVNRIIDKKHKFTSRNVEEFIDDLEYAKYNFEGNKDEEKAHVKAVVHWNIITRDIKFDKNDFGDVDSLIRAIKGYGNNGNISYHKFYGELLKDNVKNRPFSAHRANEYKHRESVRKYLF